MGQIKQIAKEAYAPSTPIFQDDGSLEGNYNKFVLHPEKIFRIVWDAASVLIIIF